MIKQIILYFIFLNLFLIITPAQEVVTGLQSNRILIESGKIILIEVPKVSVKVLTCPFSMISQVIQYFLTLRTGLMTMYL